MKVGYRELRRVDMRCRRIRRGSASRRRVGGGIQRRAKWGSVMKG